MAKWDCVHRERVKKDLEEAIQFVASRGYDGIAHIMHDAISMLNEQEAEIVIRCKDCKYRDEEITVPAPAESLYESFTFASCPCKSFGLEDDFYCGMGEWKEGGSKC